MLLNPPNRLPGAINRNGLRNARGAAADPLADFYGTGMEQMPMHYAPEDAVLDGSGNVTAAVNKGGAGAAFNGTATGTGIKRLGNLFDVQSAASGLQLATAADLVGTRLFVVAAFPANGFLTPRLFGRDTIHYGRIHASTGGLLMSRENVSAFVTGTPPGTALRLFEIEIAAGQARFWVDGVLRGTTAIAWADFLVPLLFTAGAADGFIGLAGDIASVITDGTPDRDATMLAVRQVIAAKHGIALS